MIVSTNHTLLMACLALALGIFAVKHTKFLRNNHIPEAVVGGFIVAIALFSEGWKTVINSCLHCHNTHYYAKHRRNWYGNADE